MKTVLVLVITWTVLVAEIVTTAQAAPAQASRVSVSYVPPKNPAHQPIYEQLKELRFLENLQEFLSPFQLPRTLLVKAEGCDGDANASYENDTITVCYEYVDELWKAMPAETTADGVAPVDALVGPLFDTCLHEFSHAFDEAIRRRAWHARATLLQSAVHRLWRRCATVWRHGGEGIFAEGKSRGLQRRIPAGRLCVRRA